MSDRDKEHGWHRPRWISRVQVCQASTRTIAIADQVQEGAARPRRTRRRGARTGADGRLRAGRGVQACGFLIHL
jgi:hypothetical protein